VAIELLVVRNPIWDKSLRFELDGHLVVATNVACYSPTFDFSWA